MSTNLMQRWEAIEVIIARMETLVAVGIGIGLSSVAGIRAYLPVLLVGLAALVGIFGLVAPFGVLDDRVAIIVLVVLAVLEIGFDKFRPLSSRVNILQTPIRIAAGAILFAIALKAGLDAQAVPELVAGGVIAGAAAVLKLILRPSAGETSGGVSPAFLSSCEDATGLIGGIVAVFVPFVSLILVAFLLFFFYRVRRRRGRKYRGLRILSD